MIAKATRIDARLKLLLMAACVGIVAAVGGLDYFSGYEMFFFIFYLLAVMLAVWWVSTTFGVLISVLSVAAWSAANLASAAQQAQLFIPVWNATIMLAFYLVVVVLLAKLRNLHMELDERVRRKAAKLTREIEERTRLQKELLATSEREQTRIGRELHDGLSQHLTGTALASQLLYQKLADKSQPESDEAARLVDLTEEAIELTRTLARSLQPLAIPAEGLADNFQELAATASERFKVACHFHCPHPVKSADPTINSHLYRIAQEAVANAVKHGKSKQISICLEPDNNSLMLTITDDGVGLPANPYTGTGLGLRLMAYRATIIGGTFNIERQPPLGTRVTCTVPLAGAAPENHAAKN